MPETTDLPDLDNVSDEALSAFLYAAAMGHRSVQYAEHTDKRPGYITSATLHLNRWIIGSRPSLLSPSGAESIIEAMGEEGWRCDREYHGPGVEPHRTLFWRNGAYASRHTGKAWGKEAAHATAVAAIRALWPTASPEARALLTSTENTDD